MCRGAIRIGFVWNLSRYGVKRHPKSKKDSYSLDGLNFAPKVPVFDANVGVGHQFNQPAPFDDAAGLLHEMQRHGVDRALIYHVQGESISGLDGNEALAAWAEGNSQFNLQWTVGPRKDSLRQLQDFHVDGLVNSARINSTRSGSSAVELPFVEWLYGDLLEWLQAEGAPLWISLADTPATEIMSTLNRFPDLVTVLLGAHYTHALLVHPLLKHLPNAHLELSRYEVQGGVEALKGEFGVERLIYGSFYPRYAMGPMLYALHHMDLTETELSAICEGNLKRVLGEETVND